MFLEINNGTSLSSSHFEHDNFKMCRRIPFSLRHGISSYKTSRISSHLEKCTRLRKYVWFVKCRLSNYFGKTGLFYYANFLDYDYCSFLLRQVSSLQAKASLRTFDSLHNVFCDIFIGIAGAFFHLAVEGKI